MAPEPKLSEIDVKRIRRRVRAGARKTDLAAEYGVDRKTITRRLAELQRAERAKAQALAERRLRWQARRERLKLREQALSLGEAPQGKTPAARRRQEPPSRPQPQADAYSEWLDTAKNLSGRALAEARGLIRIRSVDGRSSRWVERAQVGSWLDAGWLLDD